jgi:hypothetical protein
MKNILSTIFILSIIYGCSSKKIISIETKEKVVACEELPKNLHQRLCFEYLDTTLRKSYRDSLCWGYTDTSITNFFTRIGETFRHRSYPNGWSETLIGKEHLVKYIKRDTLGRVTNVSVYDRRDCIFDEIISINEDEKKVFHCNYSLGNDCYVKRYVRGQEVFMKEVIYTPISKTKYKKENLDLPDFASHRNVVPVKKIVHFKSRTTGKDTSFVSFVFDIESYVK